MQTLHSAIYFAKKHHHGQKRKTWEDYFIHPLAVWINLHNKFGDYQLTCAGLLHDTVEDNPEIYIKDIQLKWMIFWINWLKRILIEFMNLGICQNLLDS